MLGNRNISSLTVNVVLDLLSTSQTVPKRCVYGAPMVALVSEAGATISQGCCNHWNCPACGVKRAKQEYRRIVAGSEILGMGHKLYFVTLTCRGRECSLEDAEENYYAWTNILLTNARTKAKRNNQYWSYVQITERQKKTRRHPHSHIITTFLPEDAKEYKDEKQRTAYTSEWFSNANLSSGLGKHHRISLVSSPAAVSRYVAKYMFKETMQEDWPPKWKRIRYSENFPKLPEFQSIFVVVLRSHKDWRSAEKQGCLFTCSSEMDYEIARHHIGNILPPSILDTSSK